MMKVMVKIVLMTMLRDDGAGGGGGDNDDESDNGDRDGYGNMTYYILYILYKQSPVPAKKNGMHSVNIYQCQIV